MSEEELREIGEEPRHGKTQIPWRRLLGSRDLWLVVLAYGFYGCGSWFYFSWFPIWLIHSAGFSFDGVLLTSLPFAMGFLGNLGGGVLGDRLSLRWGAKRALRSISAVCLTITVAILLAMANFHGKILVVALSSLGFGIMDLMLPAAWAMCLAIGGRFSGTATGMMNSAGQAGGFLCTVLFGYIVHATGSYDAPLWFIAGMVMTAAILFSRVDCTRGVDAGSELATLA